MRQTRMLHIFEMLVVCGVGLTLILSPQKSWDTAMTILAIALLAGGVIALGYFLIRRLREDSRGGQLALIALLAVVAVAAGIIILVAPRLFNNLFRFAAGILVAFSGILNMIKALEVKREGGKGWGILLALSLLTIALGVLIYVNPFKVQAALVIMVGAVLIYNGVLGIIAAVQE